MVSLITFASSFILLLILFMGRFYDELQAKRNFISSSLAHLDGISERILNFLSYKWKQLYQIVRYIIFVVIPGRSEEAFRQMKGKALENYNKKRDALMGKKELPQSTSASFYLKKIKEEKQNDKGGKIVDSL